MDSRNVLQKLSDSTKFTVATVVSVCLLMAKTYFDVDLEPTTIAWIISGLYALVMCWKGAEDFAEKLGKSLGDVRDVLNEAAGDEVLVVPAKKKK